LFQAFKQVNLKWHEAEMHRMHSRMPTAVLAGWNLVLILWHLRLKIVLSSAFYVDSGISCWPVLSMLCCWIGTWLHGIVCTIHL
jgi:hypothetical protein